MPSHPPFSLLFSPLKKEEEKKEKKRDVFGKSATEIFQTLSKTYNTKLIWTESHEKKKDISGRQVISIYHLFLITSH